MQWAVRTFDQLDNKTLYQLLQLRLEVFIVEYALNYQDLDDVDLDPCTVHVYATRDGDVKAYGRIYEHNGNARLGRIVCDKSTRGTGLGRELLVKMIETARTRFKEDSQSRQPIVLSSLSSMLKFYLKFGFEVVGPEYMKEGAPHYDMRLE